MPPGIHRRTFLCSAASAFAPRIVFDLDAFERPRVLRLADGYLSRKPVTVTATRAERSAGGVHDFFSEADYWWPDPANPTGPYLQRDGMSNPANFVAHREALLGLSLQMPALTAAWFLTRKRAYAQAAAAHLRAWFLNPETRMNPNLQFAQAIHGRTTGRGTGIIDTLHLVEVARAVQVLEPSEALSAGDMRGVLQWFAAYLDWMTTSKNGMEERDAKNNHATCWVTQVAAFAALTRNEGISDDCRRRFRTVLLPSQMAPDGSFPLELKRTKPYSYSLFNLEAMAGICQLLSHPGNDLWMFQLPDGRGMRKAVDFLFPYIADKRKWPYPPDVMFFDQWPLRQQSLLFAGFAFDDVRYLQLWRTLNPDPTVEEAIRNYPFRQPVLWVMI